MLLEIKDLTVEFTGMRGKLQALRKVNLEIEKGEILGVVGESGSGKSVTALSVLGLLEKNATITSGEILYMGKDLLRLSKKELQSVRGKQIGMVFQEPMTALHPTMRIGSQLAEVIRRHRKTSKKEAYTLAVEALREVHIHDPDVVARKYPFELSGGMRQRVVIALAMSAPPELLIADEPTTALDVTIQFEILKLMKELSRKRGTSILLITHDIGVVSHLCDKTVVMYAGEVIEKGSTADVLQRPIHPYTNALLHALPDMVSQDEELQSIPGEVVDLRQRPGGCAFFDRCSRAIEVCRIKAPLLEADASSHNAACWNKEETG
ncbi:ABC transporter ATP-binding protein [Aneurinibacillus sp. BA2021]|nr:ABC transporter ATP-binding protein [Aneurinibacillus sp. BA2021]